MKSIEDPTFGKMDYKYGWRMPMEFFFGDKIHTIECVAEAFSTEEITSEQQNAYQEYCNSREKIELLVAELLGSYVRDEVEDGANFKPLVEHAQPTHIIFQQDGGYGVLFNCDWDEEHGLVVSIQPERYVGPQDMFL